MRSQPFSPEPLSAGDLRRIVSKHLPAWVRACDADSQAIVMHEEVFGTSGGELFLFGCAIKYAAQTGKTVHVTCGEGDVRTAPEKAVFPAAVLEAVHQELDALDVSSIDWSPKRKTIRQRTKRR